MNIDIDHYKKLRSKGFSAAQAFRNIRYSQQNNVNATDKIVWKDDYRCRGNTIRSAHRQKEGFDIYYSVELDDYNDAYAIDGKYVVEWEKGAIRNPRSRENDSIMPFFVPKCSYLEHFQALRATKTRHEAHCLARNYVLEAVRRANSCGDDWSPVGIMVKVMKQSVVLSECSVWGYGSDYGDDAFSDAALDVEADAIGEAKKKLASLCECYNG